MRFDIIGAFDSILEGEGAIKDTAGPKVDSLGEGPKVDSLGEGPKVESLGEGPKVESLGEGPKVDSLGEGTAVESIGANDIIGLKVESEGAKGARGDIFLLF